MSCATVVLSRWMSWVLRGAACVAVIPSVGCTGEFADAQDDDEADFRADGCGAGLKKGTASQTCKYAIQSTDSIYNDISAVGACDGDAKLKCDYTYKGCSWNITSTTTCVKQQPACAAGPDVSKITLSHTFELPEGDTTCDPPGKPADLAAACMSRNLAVVNGKAIATTMHDECKAKTSPDVTKDVTCCIKKPPGGTSSGGTSSGGCDSGTTGGETTGSWTSTTSTGDDTSSSATGEPEECPKGTTLQCGADKGPLKLVCACVAPAQ